MPKNLLRTGLGSLSGSSLSDASILQQAACAVAEVVSSQSVEGTELGSQRQRPQCVVYLVESGNRASFRIASRRICRKPNKEKVHLEVDLQKWSFAFAYGKLGTEVSTNPKER